MSHGVCLLFYCIRLSTRLTIRRILYLFMILLATRHTSSFKSPSVLPLCRNKHNFNPLYGCYLRRSVNILSSRYAVPGISRKSECFVTWPAERINLYTSPKRPFRCFTNTCPTADIGNSQDSRMVYIGENYVLTRHTPDSDNITLTINWRGREVNMDRRKYEPIETTITRLKRSLYKLDMANNQKENISIDPSNESSAPRASFESCALDSTIPGTSLSTNGTNSNDPRQKNTATTPDCYSISFLSSSFECFDQKSSLLEVAQNASFLSLNDTLLQIFNNVSRICDVFLSSRAMVGCPLTVQIQSDGSLNYDDVVIDWWDDRGQLLHRGPVYIPPEFMAYRVVKAIVTHNRLPWNSMESDFCRVFDAPINRWQYERIMLFNTSPVGNATSPLQSDSMDLRVMSFNILSPTYVATDEAIQRFFPYCPHEWLDSSYRNPLILREIFLLRPHILCLQECATSAYRNYIEPVLGQQYYSWLTIKNTTSDEGCCIFIKKDIFDVVDVQSLMFKEQILRPEYSDLLNRIGAPNWLNYDEKTYFSKFHTVFQLGCFVNRSNEKSNYLFLANSHLYFHPSGKHIRLLQTYVLLYELERFKKRCGDKFGFDIETESVTIICGDFNSFSSEGAYHLVVNGWIPYHHEDFEYGLRYSHERFIPSAQNKQYLDSRMNGTPYSFGEQSERLEVPNYQGYHDAYSGHELPFTNFVKTFSGTLDYIFHSNNIKVKRCLPGITTRDAQEYEGLPSKLYPSDHISIAADF